MIPYCQYTGVGLIPWNPLARRVLTRPWSGRSPRRAETDIFSHHLIRFGENETDKEIIDHLEEVTKKLGKSMPAVAVA